MQEIYYGTEAQSVPVITLTSEAALRSLFEFLNCVTLLPSHQSGQAVVQMQTRRTHLLEAASAITSTQNKETSSSPQIHTVAQKLVSDILRSDSSSVHRTVHLIIVPWGSDWFTAIETPAKFLTSTILSQFKSKYSKDNDLIATKLQSDVSRGKPVSPFFPLASSLNSMD